MKVVKDVKKVYIERKKDKFKKRKIKCTKKL